MILTSPALSQVKGIQHGFGTQAESIPSLVLPHWEKRPGWKQVHGTEIGWVTEPQQNCGQVDALITRMPGVPLAVVTADCVPILLSHRTGKAVAAVHAGWRGTFGRITQKLWDQLRKQGEKPSDWVAAIGPCIGSCCYEVSPELIADFKKEFPEVPQHVWNPRDRILDLAQLNRELLIRQGIGEVDCSGVCTRCSTAPRFFSYRNGDRDSRQFSTILISG